MLEKPERRRLPDRIAWMKAAAAKYPEMDITGLGFMAARQADKMRWELYCSTLIFIK